jgi:hypothetical protein
MYFSIEEMERHTAPAKSAILSLPIKLCYPSNLGSWWIGWLCMRMNLEVVNRGCGNGGGDSGNCVLWPNGLC